MIFASIVFHWAPNIAEVWFVIRSTSRVGGSDGGMIGAGGGGGAGVCATKAADASSGSAAAAMIFANLFMDEVIDHALRWLWTQITPVTQRKRDSARLYSLHCARVRK